MTDDSSERLPSTLRDACRTEGPDDALREQTLARMLAVEPPRRLRALVVLVPLAAGVALAIGYQARPHDAPSIGAERPSASGASGIASSQHATELPVPAPTNAVPAPVTSAPRQETKAKLPRALTLEEETAALERVQGELRAGRPAAALAALDTYEKGARGGRLASEALFLRIQALASSGQAMRASELAERLVRDNPNSPLVDRARKYVVMADAGAGVGEPSQVGKPGEEP